MNSALKVISGFLAGTAMTFGAGAIAEDAKVVDAQADKNAMAKQYLWAQARMNETATIDLSVLSAEEASAAYAELAAEKEAFTKENLAEALYDKAVAEGVACGMVK